MKEKILLICKSIFNFIKFCFNKISNFFKGLFLFVFNKKETILCIIGIIILTAGATASIQTATAFLPLNEAISVSEVAKEFKKETNQNPNFLIYYKKITDAGDDVVFKQTEKAREIRNIFGSSTCFDVYLSEWEGKYSPGVVDYIDQNDVKLSFLCFPKDAYAYSAWKYILPLKYPTGSYPIPNNNTAEEIYINEDYAKKLLVDSGETGIDYSKLYNKSIMIPYSWKYGNAATANEKKINQHYIIKGIIDSDTQEYKHYKGLFGEFFVVNEFYSSFIPNQTYFLCDNESEYNNCISTLLNVYKYETLLSNYSSTSSSLQYQCRISVFGSKNSSFSVDNISINQHKYAEKIDKIFDTFSSNYYLFFFFSLIVLFLSFIIFDVIVSGTLIKFYFENTNSNIHFTKASFFVSQYLLRSLGFLIGLALLKLFKRGSILSCLSLNNYFGYILLTLYLVFSIVYFFSKFRKTELKI